MFWPLINSEIEDVVRNCPTYFTFRNRQPHEAIIKHTVLQEPWTKLAADLFQVFGHHYLLIVDYDSKFAGV